MAQVVLSRDTGVGAISEVGTFHLGVRSMIMRAVADDLAGRILDRNRLFVGSLQTLVRPWRDRSLQERSVIDLSAADYRFRRILLSAEIKQRVQGHLRLYSANSSDFLNSVFNPRRRRANEVAISLPAGISFK